jgi:hypothetical protein
VSDADTVESYFDWVERRETFDSLSGDKGPNVPRWAKSSVEITFPNLPEALKKKIMGQLLIAAAPCYQSPSPDCMREAFNRIAQTLFDAGILRTEMLPNLSLFVWEAAHAGGWFHLPPEIRDEFGKQQGHDDVWSDQEALFRAQFTYWHGRLLDRSDAGNSIIRKWTPDRKLLPEEVSAEGDIHPGAQEPTPKASAETKAIETMDETPLPAGGTATDSSEATASATGHELEPNAKPLRNKRGRPTLIPDERKLQALEARGGKARAQILYNVKYPTPQQIKNVPSILRHFQRTREKSE